MTKRDETYMVTNNKTIYYENVHDNNGLQYKITLLASNLPENLWFRLFDNAASDSDHTVGL
jgi:hypothetical protein